jgi:alkanesulfonate monooxygenase SsuD/methylene tetrahydromethanopterin reductase-like flavin-dependent oxidoreductase (luciferase family)
MKRYRTPETGPRFIESRHMQLGLLMLGDASVQVMVERARLAEAVGYGTVWLADERFYREVYSFWRTSLPTPRKFCSGRA